MDEQKQNPFQILKLSTRATYAEIVERRNELDASATTPEEQLKYRQAFEELMTHQQTRLEHELFELPGTRYEDSQWERFVRRFKTNPVRQKQEVEPASCLQVIDQGALIEALLTEAQRIPEGNLQAAIENPPFSLRLEQPLEVRDIIYG
ncbi:hypothetical protein EPA93_38135 [Ktedonosporobacter rubrisoli]|uniref:Uncharacterized protein n=1 Tax=Ktedonosporobacter rubrisoli TaxID=2509675 RepID=A0A4P6K1D6_KTERU|nr:hypothetical protein [Ktedonosporobacter rubrisoli]QBD81480.1 hypothetical protein EPA93_38135 [Ktedonosporobacter rubrisoli]